MPEDQEAGAGSSTATNALGVGSGPSARAWGRPRVSAATPIASRARGGRGRDRGRGSRRGEYGGGHGAGRPVAVTAAPGALARCTACGHHCCCHHRGCRHRGCRCRSWRSGVAASCVSKKMEVGGGRRRTLRIRCHDLSPKIREEGRRKTTNQHRRSPPTRPPTPTDAPTHEGTRSRWDAGTQARRQAPARPDSRHFRRPVYREAQSSVSGSRVIAARIGEHPENALPHRRRPIAAGGRR